ncbi:MAG: hypothetical protein AAF618_00015 [Pseudomonadota bacterium]
MLGDLADKTLEELEALLAQIEAEPEAFLSPEGAAQDVRFNIRILTRDRAD